VIFVGVCTYCLRVDSAADRRRTRRVGVPAVSLALSPPPTTAQRHEHAGLAHA
jgi:hypothetical protein